MPWGGIISAAGSIGGSLLSHYSAKSINEDNMAFQREVAQNGVRWKVADMKAAGLNPLLASGINATAPAGGSSAMPDYSGIGASARDVGRMLAEKTAEKAVAEVKMADEQANNAEKTGDLIDAQTEKAKAEAEKLRTDAEYREFEKWINASGKAATAVGAGVGGYYALKNLAPNSARTISGFADGLKKNPAPQSVLNLIKSGGSRARDFLKKVVRVGGPAVGMFLLTEAARKGVNYSFDNERRKALEDERREKQGKNYKSTFNIDRHF